MKVIRIVVAASIVLLAGGAVWRWAEAETKPASSSTPAAVPVDEGVAARMDVPVYLTGLGTVQAFNTVTTTARVNGQIQKVAFTEGQDVKKGELLAQIDPRPYQAQLEQAQAKQAQDKAQLANAERDLERYTTLSAMDYTSKQTVDTTRSLVAQLTAQVKSDTAAIMNAQTQLDYTSIKAPIDGRTGIRMIDIGNNVHATDTTGIVVITQLHPISVIFSLPEDDLPQVSRAMQAGTLTVTALARNDNSELDQGKVALIDNQIDQSTGTMRVKATFPNRGNTLWPGAYIDIRLLLTTRNQALTVPSGAVQRGPDGLYVYVVKPDATTEMRPIEVAEDTGTVAVINSGVTDGETIITGGQYGLKPGARVEIQAPSANTADARKTVAAR